MAALPQGAAVQADGDTPLRGQLDAYAREVRTKFPAIAEAVDRLVARLEGAGSGSSAPKVSESLPPFALPDEQGRLVTLEELVAKGPLVVAFRRGHWCQYCKLATESLAAIEARAHALGAGFIVITPDRRPYSSRLKEAAGATFPMLSDPDNGYALSLGLAIWIGTEMIGHMTTLGRDLAVYQGSEGWLLPIPATFVLDRRGIIVARHVDPDYRRRIEADEILAAIKAAADQSGP